MGRLLVLALVGAVLAHSWQSLPRTWQSLPRILPEYATVRFDVNPVGGAIPVPPGKPLYLGIHLSYRG